jgi:hypothetical protein
MDSRYNLQMRSYHTFPPAGPPCLSPLGWSARSCSCNSFSALAIRAEIGLPVSRDSEASIPFCSGVKSKGVVSIRSSYQGDRRDATLPSPQAAWRWRATPFALSPGCPALAPRGGCVTRWEVSVPEGCPAAFVSPGRWRKTGRASLESEQRWFFRCIRDIVGGR